MATPVVTGIVGLMLSVNDDLTVDEIRSKLISSGDNIHGSSLKRVNW